MDGEQPRGLSHRVARGLVWLRWPILLVWVLGAAAAWIYLPSTSKLPTAGIYALIPEHTPAFRAIDEEKHLFSVRLLPQIVVVQRNPHHLSPADQAHIVQTALRLDEGRLPGLPKGAVAAPLINTLPFLATARETSTTAITYLGFPGSISFPKQAGLARTYARHVSVAGAPASLTGLVPGTLAEGAAIRSHLRWVEIATITMIAVIIGLYMRSLVAPAITLLAAAILYVVSSRVVTWIADRLGIALHQEIEPVVVVMLLGVITDYSVFFLSGLRDRMLQGQDRLDAARSATGQFLPIVLTAGLIVCAGLATLQVASIGFVQALGPGLAIVVFITLLVALTFVPAAMAVFGTWLLWPGVRGAPRRRAGVSRGARFRRGVAHALTRRPIAVVTTVFVAALLCAGASGLFRTRLEMTPMRGLPSSYEPHRALAQAAAGFSPGIVSPMEVMLRRPGIAKRRPALALLGRKLARVSGVGAVYGAGIPGIPHAYDVFAAKNGDAVRYLVVFDASPFSADAVDALSRLEHAVPGALRSVGIPIRKDGVYFAGDTAIARDALDLVHHDLALVAAAIFAVDFVLLALFLRSLVAPFYLVAASALSLAATFGVTTYVFQDLLGYQALTYYVPLAAGVLLVAFGSDYNLFVIGRIWQESERRTPDEAIERAAPRASRAISVAGVALALSFGMLAIVPLRSFRELGFAVGFGVLVDTFVVRSLLLPSLVTLAGRTSWWPSRRGARTRTSLS